MDTPDTNIDRLLQARDEIDERLREHKTNVAVLFTDVVASTGYFDRYGDTAGFEMVDRHAQLGTRIVGEFGGRVIKTIGDSVMAEFADPAICVRASVELQRSLYTMNGKLPERDRLQLRIGINFGSCFRQSGDLFGDAVNLAARITKRTGPGQILISSSVHQAIQKDSNLLCKPLGQVNFKGSVEKEEIFEVVWIDVPVYANLRQDTTAAVARGELRAPGLKVHDLIQQLEDLTRDANTLTSGTATPFDRVERTRFVAGTVVANRYRIITLLGRGGMGEVYRADDLKLEQEVALKFLPSDIKYDGASLARLHQEVRTARQVSHQNVCRVFDIGDSDGTPFLTMEYVDGEDLQSLLARIGRFPEDRAIRLSREICGGLAATHEFGILHRDLKPANIMVDSKGRARIMDFGLAALADSVATGGTLAGTPAYMAPEQARGESLTVKTDIYSLGLVLYELFTGDRAFQRPFSAETPRLPKNPSSIVKDIKPHIDRLILNCLQETPSMRPASVLQVITALTEDPIGAPERHEKTVVRLDSRNRWRSAIAKTSIAILVLAALVVAAVKFFPRALLGKNDRQPARVTAIPPTTKGRYIAILPFTVSDNDLPLGYLAQGFSESLSNKLAEIEDIRVASIAAAEKLEADTSLAKAAEVLGSNLIVQGTLHREEQQLVVSLSLYDASQARQLWDRKFVGTKAEVFKLQDEIFTELTNTLLLKPTVEEFARTTVPPTNNVDAYFLYLRGRQALQGENAEPEGAIGFFKEALKGDPRFALAYTGIADASLRIYGVKNDRLWTQKALAAAQQAQQLNDQLPEVHSALGAVYSATGKYSEAILELKRSLVLLPNSDETYRRLGNAYLASGNGPQAIEAFQKAITLNPYFWVNQDNLGSAYFQLGDYPKALEAFMKITVLAPDIDAGFENVGNVYLQQGKYQDCIPYFQKALQVEPFFSTYSNLGTAYYFLKQYSNSADMFEKAVALNPNDAEAMGNLGDAYRAAGQKDKARTAYQQSIVIGNKELKSNPRNVDAMAEMALAAARIGNASEAEKLIRETRSIDNKNPAYIYEEAAIDAQLGKKTEGIKILQEAIAKGYPVQYVLGDPDIKRLISTPEFEQLWDEFNQAKKNAPVQNASSSTDSKAK